MEAEWEMEINRNSETVLFLSMFRKKKGEQKR